MLKVVLVFKQLHIRLKEGQVDIILNKGSIAIPLCRNLQINQGQANINTIVELYILENDATFALSFFILLGNDRKFGGNINVNMAESQPNVFHKMMAQIINSPDKHSRINYEFYCFLDSSIKDNRTVFLSHQRHDQQYHHIKHQTAILTQQKEELQQEMTHLKHLNKELVQGQAQKLAEMNEKQSLHLQKMQYCKNNIIQSEQEYLKQCVKRQKLVKLTEEYGIAFNWKRQTLL